MTRDFTQVRTPNPAGLPCLLQVLNRPEMADDSPQRHEEIPQLTNEDAWHYQDIGQDVTGHLTEFVSTVDRHWSAQHSVVLADTAYFRTDSDWLASP